MLLDFHNRKHGKHNVGIIVHYVIKLNLFVTEEGVNNLLLYLDCPESNGKNALQN